MRGLMERAAEAAEARADALRGAVRARIARALPGVTIHEEQDRIEMTGRGLVRRWLAKDELRDWREMGP